MLIGGKGETFHNGKKLKPGQRVNLQTYDRVVLANEMLIYRWPGREPLFPEPTADQVQDELERAKKKAVRGSPLARTRSFAGTEDVDDVEGVWFCQGNLLCNYFIVFITCPSFLASWVFYICVGIVRARNRITSSQKQGGSLSFVRLLFVREV